jgi:hypothetical protein
VRGICCKRWSTWEVGRAAPCINYSVFFSVKERLQSGYTRVLWQAPITLASMSGQCGGGSVALSAQRSAAESHWPWPPPFCVIVYQTRLLLLSWVEIRQRCKYRPRKERNARRLASMCQIWFCVSPARWFLRRPVACPKVRVVPTWCGERSRMCR